MSAEKQFVIKGGSTVSSTGSACQCFSGKTFEAGSCRELLKKNTALFPDLNMEKKTMRSGAVSLRSICAAMLAFDDAGIRDGLASSAVIGIGEEGSVFGNLLYWNDYVQNGRNDGQAKLFVGTLASTPICEIAIVFNIHGAVYYLDPKAGTDSFRNETASLLSLGYETILLLHNCRDMSMAAVVKTGTGIPASEIELSRLWGIPL